MICYYLCPIVGTGQVDDSYRPALVDAVPGINWSTDIPNRSAADGAPSFAFCVVCVNTTSDRHTIIASLPGVEDVLDGLLTTEATKDELLETLRSRRFDSLSLAVRTAKRARHAKSAVAHPTNPTIFVVRTPLEDGDLERWMDGLLQQQRRSALVRDRFVSV